VAKLVGFAEAVGEIEHILNRHVPAAQHHIRLLDIAADLGIWFSGRTRPGGDTADVGARGRLAGHSPFIAARLDGRARDVSHSRGCTS
jgi:hypothetical protein